MEAEKEKVCVSANLQYSTTAVLTILNNAFSTLCKYFFVILKCTCKFALNVVFVYVIITITVIFFKD